MLSAEAALIYPHQLFKVHPALNKNRLVCLLEDAPYFSQFAFHRQKLILHRASMKQYQIFLEKNGYQVVYLDNESLVAGDALTELFKERGIKKVFFCQLIDDFAKRRLKAVLNLLGIQLRVEPSPAFLSELEWIDRIFEGKRRYYFTEFYIQQRKRLNILIEEHEQQSEKKPLGGKWSYDAENRKRLPKNLQPPEGNNLKRHNSAPFVDEALEYVTLNYPESLGSATGFAYPTNFAEAEDWLDSFLEQRLALFGDYEDAISQNYKIIYHSVLTPALNIGLLTPAYIVQRALQYAALAKVPLNSLEGFLRQVIGWREYMRAIYEVAGRKQRLSNFWQHQRQMPSSFYAGNTGIEPFDNVVKHLLRTGYCHHIERLMILGNFMLLCEIDPKQVHRWFMELFIDSYDWVMVPNVFGMSQYADGGLITTKPYISSSNYILKMSDFGKGEWCSVWDALFWRFINKQRDFFSKNPRLGMMVYQLDRMPKEKLAVHLALADRFLAGLK